jgi:hypothetical protein
MYFDMEVPMRIFAFLIASALALGLTANAAEPAKTAPPAAKPLQFGDLGGVMAWRRGDKETVVYVQGQDNAWYRVDMYETCMKYPTDKGIRFITEVDDFGDRVSKVVVDRYICTVLEITKVDAPPSTR